MEREYEGNDKIRSYRSAQSNKILLDFFNIFMRKENTRGTMKYSLIVQPNLTKFGKNNECLFAL